MMHFFQTLFSTDFMAHGYCLRLPSIIRLHEISDLVIAFSYFLIPFALVWLMRIRRDLAYPWMFALFGIFILSCGATHVLGVWTLWHPIYRFEGLVKAITAVASFPTAILLIGLVPKVRDLPSAAQLRERNEALAREIAERKLVEAEVRRLNEELEQRVADRTRELDRSNVELRLANEDLAQFAWAASHDLQEPLRMVAIFSQMAEQKEGHRLTDEGRYYLETAATAARKMQTLVEDLLQYARLPQSHSAGAPARADAHAALEEARANVAAALVESGAEIRSDDALPAVAMPHAQLVQVFQNLLSNAIKYRRADVRPSVHIWTTHENGKWLFRIEDNGIGIDPHHHEEIFAAFKRLGNSDIPGSGLGLALCRRLVERNGGRIWVESEGEGKGATFCFTLPASPALQQ